MSLTTDQDTIEIFTIGDLADELGVSTRAIRYYEERNLITPGRTNGGQRIYTRRERGRLKLILRGKLAGFDLDEIKSVLGLYDTLPEETAEKAQAAQIIDMIDRRITDIANRIDELELLRTLLLDHRAIFSSKLDSQE